MGKDWNILLDRDGTVIEEKHYLCDPDKVELVPGAGEALAGLAARGAKLFLVTNQSGIGRGYYRVEDFRAVQERLAALLAHFGAGFTDVSFCPHAPDEGCHCRKPAPGQWESLAAKHGLDLAKTVMAGDNWSDIAFGLNLGLPLVILTLTGHGREAAARLDLPVLIGSWMEISRRRPDQPHILARDLPAAVDAILAFMDGNNAQSGMSA